jgi:hypothetical protein
MHGLIVKACMMDILLYILSIHAVLNALYPYWHVITINSILCNGFNWLHHLQTKTISISRKKTF